MADAVRVSKLGNVIRNLVRFYKEVRSELKKVIWLNRQQLTNNTITVLASCLLIGIVIWIVDAVLLKITEAIFVK